MTGWMIIAGAAIVLAALFFWMTAPRLLNKPEMKPFMDFRYAHRGLHDNESEAPENSMAAFAKAVEAGYGIELDVQMTADGKVAVAHDFHLRRICGADVRICELTYEQLREYPILKSQERIPLFSDVLKLVDGKVPLIVELKCRGKGDPIAEKADEILRDYRGAYCIESFDPRALMWYRKHRPGTVRGQLSGSLSAKKKGSSGLKRLGYRMLSHLLLNFLVRPDFIAYDIRNDREPVRRLCRRMGCPSVAWTVRTPEDYEKAKQSYDLFIFEKVRL